MQPNDMNRSCLRVAVSAPVKGTFTYAVPQSLASKAHVGARALVPFNNRKVTGYILERIPPDREQGVKEVLDILDPEPLFHEQLIPFLEWMADYYIHPIGQVIQSALPGGLNMSLYRTASLTERGLGILDRLPSRSEEKRLLSWVRHNPGKRLHWPLQNVYALQKRGWLTIEDRAKNGRAGPLMRKFVRPVNGIDLQSVFSGENKLSRAKNEGLFLETAFGSDVLLLSDLTARFTNGAYLVNKWVKKGVLTVFTGPVYRNPAGRIISPSPVPPILHEQQRRILSHIQECLDKMTFSSCLLFGVTGSGKTEVYYRAVEHTIRSGRQTILMVPEISLAVYMEGLFRSRLGDRMAIYHSGLGEGERYDQWMRMVRGEVDLVIGARSALFAPLPRLGLIIVDEEHDLAYKQEVSPRYQARDAAIVRAKKENSLVILGSGTPSVQSFQNSIIGRHQLLSMPDRVENRPLPHVEIVDMKTLKGTDPKNEMISRKLREAVGQNLLAGNQTILFLNRRGFHRFYLCRSCGQSVRCPNCEVALTYHLREERLNCHYCGFSSKTQIKCSSCGSEGLKPYGFGTEKLEQELKRLFPKARIARMDTDSTRRKGQAFQILRKFSACEVDILVGTQMITKGYDFPMVTLVGVIAADLSLAFPDFRAGERTFQILSQVAGRSGRGSQAGRVIIQTFNPEHYAIGRATTHDYRSFFGKEQKLREQLGYPPFSHLACLRLKGNNKGRTAEAVRQLSLDIRKVLNGWPKRGKEIQVLGPVEAPIPKMKGKYRWHILIKSTSASLSQHLLTEIERLSRKALQSKGVHLTLDVDPYQMI
ncbi:MAG: primosomal protein N' [Thermodesulfobacteriota bacterium]|nr:primosomal protein N' [Thermodesulfobacteriota bacterium]